MVQGLIWLLWCAIQTVQVMTHAFFQKMVGKYLRAPARAVNKMLTLSCYLGDYVQDLCCILTTRCQRWVFRGGMLYDCLLASFY